MPGPQARRYKTRALCLRTIPFAETSQVVHLATAEQGLVAALAKGARRPGRALQGGLSLLAYGEAELAPRRGAELELLVGFRQEDRFRRIGRDLDRYLAACHVVELLRAWMRPGLENAALLGAGLTALKALAGAGIRAIPGWVVFFEARAVSAAGHRPRFDGCAVCDTPLAEDPVFSPLAGGLAHRECAPPGPRLSTSPADRRAWTRIYTARLPELLSEPPAAAEVRAARRLHDLWIPHVLERRPTTFETLPGIRADAVRGRRGAGG